MKALLLLLAITATSLAAPMFVWEPSPLADEVEGYNPYQVSATGARTLIATTTATTHPVPFPIPAGRLEYIVTAFNARGESPPSNPAVIPAATPGKPAKPRIVSGSGG